MKTVVEILSDVVGFTPAAFVWNVMLMEATAAQVVSAHASRMDRMDGI